MRIIHFRIAATAACLLAVCTGLSMGAVPVPYVESFNRIADGGSGLPPDWTSPVVGGTYIVGAAYGVEGKGLRTEEADLALAIDGAPSNVWCRIVSKPTPYDDDNGNARPTVDAEEVVAFYIADRATDVLCLKNGENWTDVALPTSYNGGWYTFIVHIKFNSAAEANDGSWDIYSGGSTYLSACSRLNTSGAMALNNGSDTGLSQLSVVGLADIDAVAMAVDHKTPTESRANVVVKTITLPSDNAVQDGFPVQAYALTEEKLQDDDGGQDLLGQDLKRWLVNGAVKVGSTNYIVTDSEWEVSPSAEDVTIPMATGVTLAKTGGGPFACFSDYTTARTAFTINITGGVNATNVTRWNSLSWSGTTPATLAQAGLPGTTNTLPGDLIYMRVVDRMTRLFYKSPMGWTANGVSAFTGQLQPGQGFWYYRNSDSVSRTWSQP